jgi:hypothetical protein
VQRNLWKIREDPGEIQNDYGKMQKILDRRYTERYTVRSKKKKNRVGCGQKFQLTIR